MEAAVRAWSGPGLASSASTRPVPLRSRSAGRCRRDSSRPRLTGGTQRGHQMQVSSPCGDSHLLIAPPARLPHRASSIDVDARVTPLDRPGNPKAAAPEQRVSAQPAIQRLRRSISTSSSRSRRGRLGEATVSPASAETLLPREPAHQQTTKSAAIHATRQQDDGRAGHTAGCCFRLNSTLSLKEPAKARVLLSFGGEHLPRRRERPA